MKLFEQLEQWIPPGESRVFGQAWLSRDEESGEFRAVHVDDKMANLEDLQRLTTVEEARSLAKYCAEGDYRPLKTAPTLKNGWSIVEKTATAFYELIDAIYPAVFATTVRYFEGKMEPVPLRTTLERQTGMYRFASSITDQQANQIMRDTCAKGCLRVIAWPIDSSCPVSRLRRPERRIPQICTEACTFAVSEARRLAKEAYDKANAP